MSTPQLMRPEKETIGVCQKCQQTIMVQADDEYWNDTSDVDWIATMRCNCVQGTSWRMKTRRKEQAVKNILENISDEAMQKVMLYMVDPLVEGDVHSFSLNRGDGLRASLRLNKDGNVRIALKKEANQIIE